MAKTVAELAKDVAGLQTGMAAILAAVKGDDSVAIVDDGDLLEPEEEAAEEVTVEGLPAAPIKARIAKGGVIALFIPPTLSQTVGKKNTKAYMNVGEHCLLRINGELAWLTLRVTPMGAKGLEHAENMVDPE